MNVNETKQYYVADDMGSKIITVIERPLGHQIPEGSLICFASWVLFVWVCRYIPGKQFSDKVCVWSQRSLNVKCCHFIPEGPACTSPVVHATRIEGNTPGPSNLTKTLCVPGVEFCYTEDKHMCLVVL
ncbi:hypothetical protein HF086_000487 [Spodoptera exigua]|uniref:Uncharacterized protein n=1 Tax=Spodoptera exigua TaxID=7107 RepID=A0A922MYP5_SPOEX|nr:hypothetical protein HF086_000487 [Spodoptera exigua]